MVKRLILFFFLLLLVLSGCNVVNTEEKSAIKETIKILTADNMMGRLTGTNGNNLAVQFIEEEFRKIELSPINSDGYLIEYPHQFYNPESSQFRITVSAENGKNIELTRGLDFLERAGFSNYASKQPFTFDADDPNLTDSYVILETSTDFQKVFEKAKGIFVVEELFSKTLAIDTIDKPIIQISKDTYKQLKKIGNGEIEILSEFNMEEIKAFNVVGKISGQDSENALIISAHLDHIGWVNDTIFHGAIDNASGIAILLDVAKLLKQHSEKINGFTKDIIIVAFNGEESGLQGSYHFVDYIKDRYEHIYNINLDSINSNPVEILSGDEDTLVELIEDIYTFLDQRDISVNIDTSMGSTSDHTSFLYRHINAISIGSQNVRKKIHHPFDTANEIDYDFLAKLSSAISQFIIEHDHKNYEHVHTSAENLSSDELKKLKEQEEMFELERQGLKYDEFKLVEVDEIIYALEHRSYVFYDPQELKQYYSDLYIPTEIGDYHLEEIKMINSDSITKIGSLEIDKVYKKELLKENIRNITLNYHTENITNNQILQINIEIEPEIHNDHIHEHEDKQGVVKEIYMNGEKYSLNFDSEENILYYFTFKKELNSMKFDIRVGRGEKIWMEHNSREVQGIATDLSEKEVEKLILNEGINKLVDDVLQSLAQ